MLFRSFRINSVAGLEYEPGEYGGRAILFRAEGSRPRGEDPVTEDLNRLVKGGVEVHSVPGNHMSIILERKGSAALAARVRECLDRA